MIARSGVGDEDGLAVVGDVLWMDHDRRLHGMQGEIESAGGGHIGGLRRNESLWED